MIILCSLVIPSPLSPLSTLPSLQILLCSCLTVIFDGTELPSEGTEEKLHYLVLSLFIFVKLLSTYSSNFTKAFDKVWRWQWTISVSFPLLRLYWTQKKNEIYALTMLKPAFTLTLFLPLSFILWYLAPIQRWPVGLESFLYPFLKGMTFICLDYSTFCFINKKVYLTLLSSLLLQELY